MKRSTYIVRITRNPGTKSCHTNWISVLATDEDAVRQTIREASRTPRLMKSVGGAYTMWDSVDVWTAASWLKEKGYGNVWDYMEKASDAEFREIARLCVPAQSYWRD